MPSPRIGRRFLFVGDACHGSAANGGFTLVEVLGALVIAGLLWASAAHLLPQVAKYVAAQSERRHHLRQLDTFEALFGRDVRAMARLDGGRGGVQGTQRRASWHVVTANGTIVVTYRVDPLGGGLVREERRANLLSPPADRSVDSGPEYLGTRTTVVAGRVSRVEFSYFDAETRSWSVMWDGNRRGRLPDAIAALIMFDTDETPHRAVAAPRSAGDSLW